MVTQKFTAGAIHARFRHSWTHFRSLSVARVVWICSGYGPTPRVISEGENFVADFVPNFVAIHRMFSHEKLHAYRKTVDFVARVVTWANTWDTKHAFIDHLLRAAESIALNLAEA